MDSSYWSRFANHQIGRRRALAMTGGAAVGAALLAACGGGSSSSSEKQPQNELVAQPADNLKQARRGGTLKLTMYQDVQGFDPGFANVPNEAIKIYAYSWLMAYEAGFKGPTQNKVIPDIGESWEFSPDGLTLTVKMRQGVKWHNKPPVNGRPLDIDDVVFSYKRMAEKGAPRGDIVNAVNPNAPVLSFTAADRNTIVVKLKEPTSFITAIFAYATGVMPILPKETDTTWDIRADQIGTGPFVLDKYSPSVGFTYKRNADYYNKEVPYADVVEMPIVSEYAARMAQFKAGNIYALFGQARTRAEDIVSTKRDAPDILIYEDDILATSLHSAFGWLPEGKSPWVDERVRQAFSMSLDRDAFIDTLYNVSRFKADGLPVETAWHTCLNQSFRGFWLDPKSKEFGPNAKYFQHDVAEAKKLLAAAGHAGGLPYVSTYPEGTAYGADFPNQLQIIEGMAREAGFKPEANPVNYTAEFIPKYRDGRGQHEGMAYKIGPGYATDAIARFVYEIYGKGGSNFYGFSANGKNDQAGDPVIDALIDKAKFETDTAKQQAYAFDIQREMGKKQWMVMWPGGASSFLLAWPVVQGFQTYRVTGPNLAPAARYWVDDTKPPLKKA